MIKYLKRLSNIQLGIVLSPLLFAILGLIYFIPLLIQSIEAQDLGGMYWVLIFIGMDIMLPLAISGILLIVILTINAATLAKGKSVKKFSSIIVGIPTFLLTLAIVVFFYFMSGSGTCNFGERLYFNGQTYQFCAHIFFNIEPTKEEISTAPYFLTIEKDPEGIVTSGSGTRLNKFWDGLQISRVRIKEFSSDSITLEISKAIISKTDLNEEMNLCDGESTTITFQADEFLELTECPRGLPRSRYTSWYLIYLPKND